MKTINLLKKHRLTAIVILVITLFVGTACEEDDGIGFDDQRYLPGELAFFFDSPNPKTGLPYTEAELAELLTIHSYDPRKEGKFEESDPINISLVFLKQIKELTITHTTTNTVLQTFTEGTADGDKFRVNFNTTLGDLGLLELKDRTALKWDFVYADESIGSVLYKVSFVKFEVIDPNADLSKNLVGYWRFDDPNNLGAATIGNDLILNGAASHSAASGVNAEDGAALVDVGTWYDVDHGMAASGGDNVNTYTMIWDVKVAAADLGTYICFLQNNIANDSDGAVYIHPNAGFWFNGGPGGHAEGTIQGDTWHRVVLAIDAPELRFYVDGVEIYKDEAIASVDGTFSLDLAKTIILGENSSNDGNGEDNPITISEFMLFDTAFPKAVIESFPAVTEPAIPSIGQDLVGRWKFDDAADLTKATIGNDLTLNGAASNSAASGVNAEDGAALVDVGTWYDVDHGLAASGGTNVNTYTMIWDVKVAAGDLGTYICFLQNNIANDSDGAVYIHPNAGFWFNGGPGGHAEGTIQGDTWHRVVLAIDAPELRFYVDGVEIYKDEAIAGIDGTFSLNLAKTIILGENSSNDGNGEDNPITISDFLIFDKALSKTVIEGLPAVDTPVL